MNDATIPITMPHMGVSVDEGTVLAWLKAEGDAVAADEVVCEIATDKVDTEVVAPADGVLARIVVPEGDTVAVGEPLAEMAVDAAAAEAVRAAAGAGAATTNAPPPAEPQAADRVEVPEAAPPPADEPPAPSPGASAPPKLRAPAELRPHKFDPVAAAEALLPANGKTNGPVASPLARRLAAEHGVDLRKVRGSGRRGRIRKPDVLAAIDARSSAPAAAAPPSDLLRGYEDVPREVVALSRLRGVMAEHMIRSRQTAAHMTTEADVDMGTVARARAELNPRREELGQRRLTALAFITRAACAALAEYPDLNATFDGQQLIRWREVNMGIAVDTDQGLIVPVIRGCEGLTAPAIGDAIAELAGLARSRKLTPDHVRAGTFTISNPGSVGGISAMAIINQPQVAILGTPATVRKPVVITDEHGAEAVAIRPLMRLALTFDHRVIDGAYATRCVVRMKQLLETWPTSAYA
jgi:pyruvate dehydrogenase E2 component (dihydrolipoyllysine-residue acetyltransferase)